MAIELPDLENLSPEAVDAAHAYVTQRMAEYAPNSETKRGVIHDIVLYLEGVFGAAHDEWADRLRKSGSLKAIQADPTIATDEIVDDLLSNFRFYRKGGASAGGRVVVVLNAFVPSNIPAGLVMIGNGQEFVTETAFAGRVTQASVVSPTDRLIRPVGDGTYSYVIDVVAAKDGTAGMIRRGTKLSPQTFIPHAVTLYAEADFIGGVNPENNAELVARMQEGIAGKNASNRVTLAAMLREDERFERVLAVSMVGYGDPEQLRYHGVLPVASGGRLDVYLRSQGLPGTVRLEKTASLVDQLATGGVWQVGIERLEAPGFYDVEKIVRKGANEVETAGYEVTEDTRTLDVTSADETALVPDLETATEAAYSSYQAGVVQFLDTDTDASLPIGTKRDYVVVLRAMPLVGDLQNFLAGRDVRPGAGDVLVRGAIPCDVRLTFKVLKRAGQTDPDLAAMKSAVAEEVSGSGFPGQLSTSTLQAVAHRFLVDGQATGAMDLWGIIRRPDGTKRQIRSTDKIVIPDEPDRMVSGRTVAFFLDPEDVSISVEVIDVPAV
jgi:hypothetical protein